jgi:hypothetical protein
MLLDDGERIIMNSSAASTLALVLDLVAAFTFLRQTPPLAALVVLVSYPVWWLISNVITVFCWVMTLAITAGISRRYRLFVAMRRNLAAKGVPTLPPVALVITDDMAASNSRWMLVRPVGIPEDTLLRASTTSLAPIADLPRPIA